MERIGERMTANSLWGDELYIVDLCYYYICLNGPVQIVKQ